MPFLERLLYYMFAYDCCVPGGLLGEAEVECPHCGHRLAVPVNKPDGTESYYCCQCVGSFEINWVTGRVAYDSSEITLSIEIELEGEDLEP